MARYSEGGARSAQLQDADRKYTDAEKFLPSFSTGHVYHRDAIQNIIDEVEKLTLGPSVNSNDLRTLQDSISAAFEQNQSRIETAKTSFISRHPKSARFSARGRKEDGSVGHTTKFTT